MEPTTTHVAGEKKGVVVPPSYAVSVLRAVSEKTIGARCLDFSSFYALSPFSSCVTTARCGTTLRSQTSPEYPKSRSCARCGTTLRSLTSPEKPKSLFVNLDGRIQRAQERDFGYSGDVCERMVVPQRAAVVQEENGDSEQKEEKSRQRALVIFSETARRTETAHRMETAHEGGTTAPCFSPATGVVVGSTAIGDNFSDFRPHNWDCVEREKREQNGGGVFGGTHLGRSTSTQLDQVV
ncbi:hypothetical protein Fot_16101 [Forsythia ovata]|uniref:Uncharacterized protein n=1 Tax=Forsythia ovata TaxID=205694 RepID=A0ABD1WB21_9LAMI